jgi:hypothetical protein
MWAIAVGLFCLVLADRAADADEGEPTSPATNVLERFVGDWTTSTHFQTVGPPARELCTRGKATCRATLGGNWFEFRAETGAPDQADLQIMTYDREAGVYRQWVFSADGYHHEAVGTWIPDRSTLRWEGTSGGAPFVIEDRWASPDRLEWTLQRTDATGMPRQTIEGTVTRVESPKTP